MPESFVDGSFKRISAAKSCRPWIPWGPWAPLRSAP